MPEMQETMLGKLMPGMLSKGHELKPEQDNEPAEEA